MKKKKDWIAVAGEASTTCTKLYTVSCARMSCDLNRMRSNGFVKQLALISSQW